MVTISTIVMSGGGMAVVVAIVDNEGGSTSGKTGLLYRRGHIYIVI